MSGTRIPFGSPLAIKRWSAAVLNKAKTDSVWAPLIGQGETANTPVVEIEDLRSEKGDEVTIHLAVPIGGAPVVGDDRLEGTEADLSLYTDDVAIDLMSKSVDCGGLMSKKRTVVDLRMYAKDQLSDYFTGIHDELLFMYAAAGRGVNPDFRWPLGFTGHAGNAFEAPDSDHIIYPGSVASKATLTSGDEFSLELIERARTRIQTLGGNASEIPEIRPIKIGGKSVYVCMMHEWQMHKLRTTTGEGKWMDLQKALIQSNGEKNAIFTGAEAMHAGIILRSHKNVVRFSDYGVGANVAAARAVVMGKQAMGIAYGDVGKGYAADWHEQKENRGANPVITGRLMVGVKKLRSNGRDVGMMSLDTAVTAV